MSRGNAMCPVDGKCGYYQKYHITKVSGEPCDPNADYFVLRLDTDKAARIALLVYAFHCDNETLQQDIKRLLDKYK